MHLNYSVAMSNMTWSVKCSPLKGACDLTFTGPLGSGQTLEWLERPVLMGLHLG